MFPASQGVSFYRRSDQLGIDIFDVFPCRFVVAQLVDSILPMLPFSARVRNTIDLIFQFAVNHSRQRRRLVIGGKMPILFESADVEHRMNLESWRELKPIG